MYYLPQLIGGLAELVAGLVSELVIGFGRLEDSLAWVAVRVPPCGRFRGDSGVVDSVGSTAVSDSRWVVG